MLFFVPATDVVCRIVRWTSMQTIHVCRNSTAYKATRVVNRLTGGRFPSSNARLLLLAQGTISSSPVAQDTLQNTSVATQPSVLAFPSWPVLKARTQNRGGTAKLRSTEPREVPDINFPYFDAGCGDWQHDLAAIVEGLQYARSIIQRYANDTGPNVTELIPGPKYGTAEDLVKCAKDTSWGHPACCTAKIGDEDDLMAVLDSKFRVRGTRGLRVVDGSVFPKILGYYIQLPSMKISEKAAVNILNDSEHLDILRPFTRPPKMLLQEARSTLMYARDVWRSNKVIF